MDKHQYDLIKLIENSVETPRKIADDEILAWLYFHQIEDFAEIVGHGFFVDSGFTVVMQSDSICINLKDVIDYMDIDEDVFEIDWGHAK